MSIVRAAAGWVVLIGMAVLQLQQKNIVLRDNAKKLEEELLAERDAMLELQKELIAVEEQRDNVAEGLRDANNEGELAVVRGATDGVCGQPSSGRRSAQSCRASWKPSSSH